ncbi:hypothetical protein L6Q96_06595 [Candidatus Binatia bacterium]|nr:hypothetical protein [Candidatus Binatia bacterium]
MRRCRSRRTAGLSIWFLLACLSGCGANIAAAPNPGTVDALTDSEYLTGESQPTGEYVGTLVALPCAVTTAGRAPACDGSARRFGLLIDGDVKVHRLVAGDTPVRAVLDAGTYSGKRVRVLGVFYPTLDTIRVSEIEAPAR